MSAPLLPGVLQVSVRLREGLQWLRHMSLSESLQGRPLSRRLHLCPPPCGVSPGTLSSGSLSSSLYDSQVPRCVPNACPVGRPLVDDATFEPVFCRDNTQCRQTAVSSFCRSFRSNGGYCCPSPGCGVFERIPRTAIPCGDLPEGEGDKFLLVHGHLSTGRSVRGAGEVLLFGLWTVLSARQ